MTIRSYVYFPHDTHNYTWLISYIRARDRLYPGGVASKFSKIIKVWHLSIEFNGKWQKMPKFDDF